MTAASDVASTNALASSVPPVRETASSSVRAHTWPTSTAARGAARLERLAERGDQSPPTRPRARAG